MESGRQWGTPLWRHQWRSFVFYISRWWRQMWNTRLDFTVVSQSEARVSMGYNIYIYVYMYVYIYLYVCSIYIYIHMYVYIYMHVYIHIHVDREREREKERERLVTGSSVSLHTPIASTACIQTFELLQIWKPVWKRITNRFLPGLCGRHSLRSKTPNSCVVSFKNESIGFSACANPGDLSKATNRLPSLRWFQMSV